MLKQLINKNFQSNIDWLHLNMSDSLHGEMADSLAGEENPDVMDCTRRKINPKWVKYKQKHK